MLKKEFREIIAPALLRLSLLLIFPLWYLFGMSGYGYLKLSSLTFQFIIIWIAGNYGMDAFSSEHKDQALEYLLSFPYTKFQIFLYKLVPRVTILLFLTIVHFVTHSMITGPAGQFAEERLISYLVAFFSPLCLIMFFFLCGFFVSLYSEHKKSRLLLNLAVFFSFFIISLGVRVLLNLTGLIRFVNDISIFSGAFIVTAIMSTAFVSLYRKIDLNSAAKYSRRFSLRVVLPLLVLDGLSFFILIKNSYMLRF